MKVINYGIVLCALKLTKNNYNNELYDVQTFFLIVSERDVNRNPAYEEGDIYYMFYECF